MDQEKKVLFLGAGFTKALVRTAPTGIELFQKAFTEELYEDDESIKEIKKFIESIYFPIENDKYPTIEDVLSLLDYCIQRNESLSRKYIIEDLFTIKSQLIYLIGTVIKNSIEGSTEGQFELWKAFSNFIGKHQYNLSIISTNYDIVIDNILLENKSCNYGIPFRFNVYSEEIDVFNKPSKEKKWRHSSTVTKLQENGIINKGRIPLLKIHGSLNWFYCPKCEVLDITIGKKGAVNLSEKPEKYFCAWDNCTSHYVPIIVTPTMLKVYNNPILKDTWKNAENVIRNAKRLTFIGYSLPYADYHIRSLLTKAKAFNENELEINVIERKSSEEGKLDSGLEEVKFRYEHLFGNINFYPIGLEEYVEKLQKEEMYL